MENEIEKLIGKTIELVEEGFIGHYRKKNFFKEYIRIIPQDISLDKFRPLSAAFEEALDIEKVLGESDA